MTEFHIDYTVSIVSKDKKDPPNAHVNTANRFDNFISTMKDPYFVSIKVPISKSDQ